MIDHDSAGTLLLVDDDLAKRHVIATWLRRAGHTVDEAGTGQEALDRVSAAELVLLDVHLPDMSGFEVCRLIKSNQRTAAIPVIQVSATATDVAARAHGLTQGADAYLAEPTEPAELLATVTAVLRYFRARQRAERTAALLSELVAVSLNINAAETFDGLAAAAASGATRIFSVPAVLFLEMPDGQTRRTSAVPGSSGTVRRGGPPGLGAQVAEHVLKPGLVSAITTIDEKEWLRLVPDSTLAVDVYVAVARTKPGRPPATVAIDVTGISGEDDRQILRQLAQSVALSVDALRASAEEHLVALTLQRSFLPAALPAIPGVQTAFRYLPASDQAEVGGDFYEALAVPGRRARRHRRRPGTLAAGRDRDGGAAARAARLRQRGAFTASDHRPAQRGAAALSPGPDRHAVPGAA